MDDALPIAASALVGLVIGYAVSAWRKLPRAAAIDSVVRLVTPNVCEHRFDTMHRDGRWRCGICGKQRVEEEDTVGR